jgi:hypothetical protein
VSALSPAAVAVLLAVLLASMWRAFVGPPAPFERPGLARGLLGATAGCYLAGAALVTLAGATLGGALLIGAGIEAACLGAWLVRGGDDGPGGEPRPRGPADPAPWDWDAFDRARRHWGERGGRPRAGV